VAALTKEYVERIYSRFSIEESCALDREFGANSNETRVNARGEHAINLTPDAVPPVAELESNTITTKGRLAKNNTRHDEHGK
jgi:hypothetical protein